MRTGRIRMLATVAACISGAEASAVAAPAALDGSGAGPGRIPTGQYITGTAAPGSVYQRLTTGLRADGNADADSAMSGALSPDGTTLLVLTSGFNVATNQQVQQTTASPVPLLFPALNPVTGIDTPFTNPNGSSKVYDAAGNPQSATTPGTQLNQAEFVFVFDVRTGTPQKVQQIYVPDTFDGLAWDPSGKRFYVSGGVDDRVLIYKRSGAQFVPDAPFLMLGHNDLDTQTLPLYDGGVLRFTPLGQQLTATIPSTNPYFKLLTGAVAAGFDVSRDGKTMVVANFGDASASIVDLSTRKVSTEIPFTTAGATSAADAKGEYPFWVAVRSNPSNGAFLKAYVSSYRDDDVMVVSPGSSTAGEIKVPSGPNKMALSADGATLYVACGRDDSIAVVDTATDTVGRVISIARPGYRYKGSTPTSIAVAPDGKTLYVTLGGENAVAVVDALSGRVLGRIPTGWLPTSVSLSSDGTRLFVLNEKSNAGPNPGQAYYSYNTAYGKALNPTNANLYTWEIEKSGLLTIPLPDSATLARLSAMVDANNGFSGQAPGAVDAVMTEIRRHIKHVIYIINENRTFDQVLGDLGNGSNGDPQLTFFTQNVAPNLHALAANYVTLDNFYDSSETSGVGWNWVMQGHTDDFVEKTQPVQYGNARGAGLTYDWQGIVANINLGMPASNCAKLDIFNCRITTIARNGSADSNIFPGPADPSASEGSDDVRPTALGGYIWESALRAGLTVRNYGWQIDLNYYNTPLDPDPAHTRNPGTKGVLEASPSTPTIQAVTDRYYRAFDMTYPDIYRIEEWQREFAGFVQSGTMPNLMVMTIPHDHFGSFATAIEGLRTPQLEMADHDYAVGRLVEAVSHSKFWNSTAIVMLEDDPQNGQDHVEGHRSYIHIISPYTKTHFVDHTTYTSVNALRTVEDLLGIEHLSMYDANAEPMSSVFATTANAQPYRAIIPGSLCASPVAPDLVPACSTPGAPKTAAVRQVHGGAWWAAMTAGMDFTHPDRLDSARFNAILEYGIAGRRAMPLSQQPWASRSNVPTAGTDTVF